jgi:DNA replication ATP-dependent helicase Dna2
MVDNQTGFFIINPDNLLSTTVIADSFNCTRKAIISDRIRSPTDKTLALVYGNMLHEIFQECLIQNDFSDKRLRVEIERAIKEHIQDLFAVDQSETVANEHLNQSVLQFKEFANNYLLAVPKV